MSGTTRGPAGRGAAGGPGESEDGADLALDWGDAARAAAAEPGEPGADPLVGPAEIDALLGARAGGGHPGIRAVIDSASVRYERLPMLEVVFDRLQRLLTSSLRSFTSENAELRAEPIRAQRFAEYLDSVPRPATIAVFRAVEWDNVGLVTVDRELGFAIVDLLMGGGRGSRATPAESRPCTSIEAALIERLVRIVLDDLAQAFAPIAPVQLRLERIETDPRFAAVTRPGNACVLLRLGVALEGRGGALEFVIPYATLEPVREILLQMFLGERLGRDSIWEQHLAREIWETEVDLEAVLDEQTVPLRRVLGLEPGAVLPLAARPDTPVLLRCGGVPMLRGRLGRVGDRVSIRIEERLVGEREE